jgi:heterodisulfide reductase subunit A-like polyferredoxin
MYAIKDSMIAKEHADEDLDCVVFNMDIRTFGKDYEKYYNRAKDAGIRFIKSRIHSIDEIGDTGNLSIRYMDDAGQLQIEEFDMVVLSVGLQVPESTVQLAERLGVELNDSRFALTHPFTPVKTTRPGVYTCGVFQGPKDIPSSITEASAAACAAGARLGAARNTLTRSVEVPEQIDVSDQDARVGVFVCNCGVNISSVVDVKGVTEYAKTLPNVVYAQENLFTCSQDSQDQMKEIIKEHKLNRVVVAACSPKTHEPIFQDTMESCGLNKYLFEMANIRNQDSWVHSETAETASGKAKDLVRMSVARAGTLHPLQEKKIPVIQKGLVIGGGVAGMNAARGLADQGYEVILIEKEAQLGGLAKQLTATIEGADIGEYLGDLVSRVTSHEKIQVITNALVVGFSGFKGNFTTEILVGPDVVQRKITHGVVILATGAHEYRPQEYLYGDDPRVMTQLELADCMQKGELEEPKQVVMIQCIGSRNDENPNCSRVCCQTAVKNALHIKEKYPDAQIYVLYRDIRTYGLLEGYYTEARRQGVFFFRFDPEDPPVAEAAKDGVEVMFTDHVLNRKLKVSTDLLVLSAGMEAEDTEELSSIVKLACGRFAGGDIFVPVAINAIGGHRPG